MNHLAWRTVATGAGKLLDGGAIGGRLPGQETRPWPVSAPKNGRDTRIDVLRGLSLLMIFVDHIPPNVANWYTLHDFSLSDAAEVFVFLAGTSSMLAYGHAFRRDGIAAGLCQIAARCARIYAVQAMLFLVTMGLAAVRRQAGYPNPIAGPILDAGWLGILRGMALDALPTYLDILPLYIVLLGLFPVVYALSRVSPWLALAASGAVWLEVNVRQNLNLPNMLSGDGWYFNPFAWQFLFTIGGLSAALLRPTRNAPPKRARLQLLCLAYLAFGMAETLDWAHWELPDLTPLDIGKPDKSLLSPFRLLSIVALMYLAFSSPRLERWCSRPFMRPLAACGRHSLEVFATGCLLAYASRFLFERFGAHWPLQVGVNVVGIGTTFAVALLLEGHRASRAGGNAQAGSGLKRTHAGGTATSSNNAGY